ncbi:MAG: hypothetical protein KGL39_46185 [Patescibacteria group bacterium]|nr:hypothetical protein [Patescibacteria group bacterium]
MAEAERHLHPNSTAVRYEHQDASGNVIQSATFNGIKEFDIVCGEAGAAVIPGVQLEGTDAEGWTSIVRFRKATSINDLVPKVKKADPTLPAASTFSLLQTPSAAK